MAFTLVNLSFGYDSPILSNLNLKYDKNRWHFFIGSTGTGKSTLLQIMSKLRKAISGDILYLGKSLTLKENLREFRAESGIMFQYTDKQFFNHTIREEILFNLKRREKNSEVIEKKLSDILKLLSISPEILERSPFELSGGQKRMVALASILITEPSVLILDEPTVGLDTESRELFFSVIQKLRERDITIFQISHSLEDVITYGDTVTILSPGRADYYEDTSVLLNEDIVLRANLEPPEIILITKAFNKFGFRERVGSIPLFLERLRAYKAKEERDGKNSI